MEHKLRTLTPALVLAIAAFAMPSATADPVETCTGPNGEPGVIVTDVEGNGTGCIHLCTGPDFTVGVNLTVNGEPLGECHRIQSCPLFESTGVIIDDDEQCYTPTMSPCPEGYYPLPTQISGVPGWPSPLLLCIAVSVTGCEGGVGVTVTILWNGVPIQEPVCL